MRLRDANCLQKAKLGVPVLCAVLFALGNVGCSPAYKFEIENASGVPLYFAQTDIPCAVSDDEILRLSPLDRMEPGEERVVDTDYKARCLVTRRGGDSSLTKQEFDVEERYVVSVSQGALTVAVVDRENEGTNWFALAGVGLLIGGAVAGLWFGDVPMLRGIKASLGRRLRSLLERSTR